MTLRPLHARIALAVIAVVAVLAVIVARRTDDDDVAAPGASGASGSVELPVLAGPAPPVTSTGWINSAPLTPAKLAGKVVLYDFWTFECINCQHTLPAVKAWYARYAPDGLVIVGVHTPEFEHEKDPVAVRDYVRRNGIDYPVALDPEWTTWRAFGNHYWPAFYLYDRSGSRRYVHFGEGSYDSTEDAIRLLLGVAPDGAASAGGVVIADHLALLGAGIASFLAPCAVPLVPVYAAMLAGDAANPTRLARNAALFVAGFSAVFVALGVGAARLGAQLSRLQLGIQRVGGALVVALGLLLLAEWAGRAPSMRLPQLMGRIEIGGDVARPLAMGVAFGAAWTPCVGPLLGAALVLAADSATAARGASLLLAYSVGIGLPFVALAVSLVAVPGLPRRLARLGHSLQLVAAAVMVVIGALLVTGWYGAATSPLARLIASR